MIKGFKIDVERMKNEPKFGKDYYEELFETIKEIRLSELPTICQSLKFKAKDEKMRNTDTLDTKGIFRLIASISSKNAEVFCTE